MYLIGREPILNAVSIIACWLCVVNSIRISVFGCMDYVRLSKSRMSLALYRLVDLLFALFRVVRSQVATICMTLEDDVHISTP
jgi:hypothetical protein